MPDGKSSPVDVERGHTPEVSVIMATYNRSNILRYAIESVRWQTRPDWQLHVIGDASTDDAADVVARFDDARIGFTNLASNVGEQSGPNNEGLRQARGKYIAFLNQDDLWLPDHLDTLIAEIEGARGDLVFPMALRWSKGRFDTYSWCVGEASTFTPDLVVPASFWLFRRELVERVGLWRNFRECYDAPSHDWLFRAYRAGAAIRPVRRLTVIKVRNPPRAYVDRLEEPHRRLHDLVVGNPRFRDDALARAVADYPSATIADALESASSATVKLFRRWLALLRGDEGDIPIKGFSPAVTGLLNRMGINPVGVMYFIRHGRKGQKLENLRVRRGLTARPTSETRLVD